MAGTAGVAVDAAELNKPPAGFGAGAAPNMFPAAGVVDEELFPNNPPLGADEAVFPNRLGVDPAGAALAGAPRLNPPPELDAAGVPDELN
jgi:hypothetical protein